MVFPNKIYHGMIRDEYLNGCTRMEKKTYFR